MNDNQPHVTDDFAQFLFAVTAGDMYANDYNYRFNQLMNLSMYSDAARQMEKKDA